MIFEDTVIFSLSLIDTAGILFLLIYHILILSDLDSDYINPQECCMKLNSWVIPKLCAHGFATFLFLSHGYIWITLFNLPMIFYLLYEYLKIPKGNYGLYDPTEICNRGELNHLMYKSLIQIIFHLICFFIYLYCFILALLKGDPIQRHLSDTIVTEI